MHELARVHRYLHSSIAGLAMRTADRAGQILQLDLKRLFKKATSSATVGKKHVFPGWLTGEREGCRAGASMVET